MEKAKNNKLSEKDLKKIIYLVKTDYEELKLKSGYPCVTLIYKFFKEDIPGKMNIVAIFIYKFVTIYLIITSIALGIFSLFLQVNFMNVISYIIVILLIIFLLFSIDKIRY